MLETLQINNFKCFSKAEILLSNINLFCGANSSGKSTAIQALLLMAHSSGKQTDSPLNGQWLSLGTFNESRNFITNAKEFEIAVQTGHEVFGVKFILPDDDEADVKTEKTKSSTEIESLLDYRNKRVFYLSAARQGPADYYRKNFDKVNFLGDRGEFVIDYFARNEKKPVKKNMLKDHSSSTLDYQVNYWLKKIMNVQLQVQDMGITNTLSAQFCYGNNKKNVRPYHIGSGVSYILGVIVSSLSAKQDDIVIIENPEIHLHPRAQADLTEFLCFIANAGVQIIVESHSDHVFNGIRKAIAKKIINKDNAAINFFEMDNDSLAKNIQIEISDNGRVLNYRKGLFDQFDDDLDQLLGL